MTLAVGSQAFPVKRAKSSGCGSCGEPAEKREPVPVPQTQEPMADYVPKGQPDIACGITTAYRPQTGPRDKGHGPTLTKCLTSVCANDLLPTVFAEPNSCLVGVEPWVPVVQRETKLGAFCNWEQMTQSLLDHNTPYVMTLQDDCRLSPSAMAKIREFMADWPDDCAMLSLYTPIWYESWTDGFSPVNQRSHPSGALLGAVGWIFKREGMIRVRDAKDVCGTPEIRANVEAIRRKYPHCQLKAGWAGTRSKELVNRVDIAVGRGLVQCGMKCYVHTPSLSQHISEDSSIPGHPRASKIGVHATKVLQ